MLNNKHEHSWMRFYQLLKKGAEPHPSLTMEVQAHRGPIGQPFLHWLCLEAEADVIKRAIKTGLEIDAQDELGNTALMEAAAAGRTEVVSALLSAGASSTITNFDGEDLADYLDLYGLEIPEALRKEDPN